MSLMSLINIEKGTKYNEMKLRKLEKKDAVGILEWMHDPDINQYFQASFADKKMEDALAFIESTEDDREHLHLAVVSDDDEYLGTISLKDIDIVGKKAEYAISMRACAHGTGASRFATTEILRIAFEELGLERVYLNVLSENKRANRFYEKFGFIYEGEFKKHLMVRDVAKDLKWYRMLKEEFEGDH